MIAASIEEDNWPRRRWLAVIGLVMLGQVGLIFWLARHHPTVAQPVITSPTVNLTTANIMEQSGLGDPTQFVLPNRKGFSGGAWLRMPALEYDPPQWTESPRPLELSAQQLASEFEDFGGRHSSYTFELASPPEPQLDPIVPLPDLPYQSTLTVEGGLEQRPLLSKFLLDSWAAPEILSNSVVQVGVQRDGTVFSAVLLGGPKDSKEGRAADAAALSLASAARFQPLPADHFDHHTSSDSDLQWGRLVFHWRTVAPPPTNSITENR